MSNKLISEKSPYLLQHKDNPVDWFPWRNEAFQKAKAENKPIFLSIGYSTCHWCHVMAHESFEDAETAKLLKPFVCIKVDREERPDIDSVYMSICQALTGSGGWPLTIFMSPDQKPFFAGTYFPKTSRYGQIGLHDLIKRITFLWQNDRERLLNSSSKIIDAVSGFQAKSSDMPDKDIITKGYKQLLQTFDTTWGGFGRAPKFPTPHNLMFLMRFHAAEKENTALQMAEKTLQSMANGGIFDHIGGGFSRYSTNEKWLVPHFEKMLYDNALLICAYLEAYQLTKNKFYADIARRTADYILNELTDPQSGFYCGQDADSDGIEGKYYVFTPDEIKAVLGEKDGEKLCEMYDITAGGNFDGKSIPNKTGKSSSSSKADDTLILKLYEYRKKRTQLHLDNKIILSWNAWAIIAFAMAGSILEESRYTEAAIKAYEFIENNMTYKDKLYHSFCGGECGNYGVLDDYAVYILALAELYERTFEVKYLTAAVKYAKQMINLFEDNPNGGFYMTANNSEQLIMRPKEVYDGAMPSGNSAAAMALEKLADLTGENYFREAADRQHKFLSGIISEYPAGHCYGLLAVSKAIYPHKELIFTADKMPNDIKEYIKNTPLNDISIIYKSRENTKELAAIAPFTQNYPVSERPLYYLCENGMCRKPENDFKNCLQKRECLD